MDILCKLLKSYQITGKPEKIFQENLPRICDAFVSRFKEESSPKFLIFDLLIRSDDKLVIFEDLT